MSDFGFAEAERKAKEQLQKDVERLTAELEAKDKRIAELEAIIVKMATGE